MSLKRTPLKRDPEAIAKWTRECRERAAGLQRKSVELARTRINPTNPKRKKATFNRAYGSRERVLLLRAMPCSVPHCERGPSDNAHTETGGLSYKAGFQTCVPLCRFHHLDGPDSYHALGSCEAFDRLHGTDLRATARRLADTIPAVPTEADLEH